MGLLIRECAERHGGNVLSADERDLAVSASGKELTLLDGCHKPSF